MSTSATGKTRPSFPIEELLANVARGVAVAQAEMDQRSLAEEIAIQREEQSYPAGRQAHWFTIPELALQVRVAFEMTEGGGVTTQMIDAAYQAQHGFDVRGSSLLETRIVAVPDSQHAPISVLDQGAVMARIGRLRRVVDVYGRCDTPQFDVRFLPFAADGYAGGLWFVTLLDRTVNGRTSPRVAAVIDDLTGEVSRLWTSDDVVVGGVSFTQDQALRALIALNKASEQDLVDVYGVRAATAATIVQERPYDDLAAIAALPNIGQATLQRIRALVAG